MNYKILLSLVALLFLMFPLNASTVDYDVVNLNAEIYNYSPTPVIAGEDFEIWIQLTNKSNVAAENINYFIETKYPFVLISENEGYIEKLEPFQSKIIKYKIKTNDSAITGTYDLEFKYSRDSLNFYNINKYVIDVKGQSAIVEITSSNVQELKIGQETIVNLTLKNLGKKDAKDVFVTIDNSEDNMVNVLNLKTIYVESIKIGEQKQISFKVNTSKNATNETYTLPITIDYSDVDREYSIERNIGLKATDEPKLLLNINNVGDNFKISPFSEESVSLEIYNVGNVDTEIVYVTLEGPMINSVQEFIGSIEKDNYDSLDIKFNTKELKEDSYPLTVKLYYKDSSLKEKIIEEQIIVENDFVNQGESNNKILMSIFGILIFIVGFSIFVLLFKWLIKVLIKPAIKVLINLFKRK